ncbi:ATP-binding cassette domain-containing protein [Aquicoccus sp. SCR17]|nr:ATP-binding cassette domain-containing protein [Carideicomes alvinocaridis]
MQDGCTLALDGVTKSFSQGRPEEMMALADISLDVAAGEFLTVVGPSGCGKSTFLQIAAGLMEATGGAVALDGRPVDGPPGGLVYLFQQYTRSLLPWRTVIRNVEFAVEGRGRASRRERREFCMEFLEMVGLADFADRYPWQLSGGMQQRVAIARALAAEPRILLLDEPFSSVDALTRMELHDMILKLWEDRRFTALLVTHDVDEAVMLSDRIAVLSSRPSRIVETIETGLPRPRDRITTPELPRFLELRHYLLESLTKPKDHAA